MEIVDSRAARRAHRFFSARLGIGYGKASRFIDYMAEDGIVGGYNGSNARQVLVNFDEWKPASKSAAV